MLAILLLAATVVTSAGAATCESLQGLALADTTILTATIVPAGPFTPPSAGAQPPRPIQIPVDACRVAGVVRPAVNFEVWMPASNWNGKFQGAGGGGFAGVISYGALATALGRGYAAASTDTGHSTPGGSWALNRPDLIVDFAYRAIHEMTVKAKLIVEAFYGNGPRLSYFVGCSTGGRQGLMSAQRFPADYDGIIAGAPANYWTHLMAGTLSPAMATTKDEASRLPPPKLAALNKGALAACDAKDGVADGLIEHPLDCRFDPAVLRCTDAETDACLTAPQVEAARTIYSPAVNPRTKQTIFPGMAPGSEITWTAMAGAQPFSIPVDFYKYFVYSNPDWDWRTFDFDKDVTAGDERFGRVMNAIDPNLQAFRKRGGKLIMYHGWNDQLIQPANSIDYYASVQKAMGSRETDETIRLFMAPGMQHCAGGVGPNTFDALGALEQWVEHGTKPARIVAAHSTNGVVDRTRPLCPFPQVATYNGRGSIDDAANFTCLSSAATAWFGLPLPAGLGDPHRPIVNVSSAAPKPAVVPPGEERHTELAGPRIRADLERIVAFSKADRASGSKAWGRITGFPSGVATMDWAAERFREAGLQHVQVQKYGGTGSMWYARTWEARLLPHASFGAGTAPVVLASALPTGGSQVPGGTLTASLVHIGDVTSEEPVTIDVKGKVVVQHLKPAGGAYSERTRVSTRARAMSAKGAVAVINVVEQTGNMHVRDFGNCGAPCFNVGTADGLFLEEVMARAAKAGREVRIQLSLDAQQLTGLSGQNVIGIVPGDNTEENIIVNAHGDGWFDAAGDNGDGFAVALAMARHFARPENKPARTLVFVISGGHHSSGLNGPANMVRMNPELTTNTVLVLNLEHVAQLRILGGPWRAESIEQPMSFGISNQAPFLIELGTRAKARYGMNLNEPFGANVPGDLGGYQPLGVARVQAIHSGPMYHTSGDGLDTISTPGLERAARFFTYFVAETAAAPRGEINPSRP